MTDPYRIDPVAEPPRPRRESGGLALRLFLWIVLVLTAVGNLVTSLTGMNTLVPLAFGLTAVLCIIALVADHMRRRR